LAACCRLLLLPVPAELRAERDDAATDGGIGGCKATMRITESPVTGVLLPFFGFPDRPDGERFFCQCLGCRDTELGQLQPSARTFQASNQSATGSSRC